MVMTDLLYSASWNTFRTEAWMGPPPAPASMEALLALMILLRVSWFLASDILSKQVASFISKLAAAAGCCLVLLGRERRDGDKTGFIY